MKRKLAIAMAMFMAFSTVVPTFGEVTLICLGKVQKSL